jgi:rare lipoprotein A
MTLRIIAGSFAAALVLMAAVLFLTSPALACTSALASWYGTESGNRTANGEHFDGTSLTAAHRSLPFGTKLRVTYRGKSVVVRVNDRGPFIKGRSLDLSRAAAVRLGMVNAGVANVCGIMEQLHLELRRYA